MDMILTSPTYMYTFLKNAYMYYIDMYFMNNIFRKSG